MNKDQIFLTVKNYAMRHGITTQAVRKQIEKGALEAKKINGVMHVKDASIKPDTGAEMRSSVDIRNEIENELKRQKIAKTKGEIELQRIKLTAIREQYRREYAEAVLQAFQRAFAGVKTFLIECKLTKQQNERFKKEFQKAIKKFADLLRETLNSKDKNNEDNIE